MSADTAMGRNAVIFDAFCRDVKAIGGKVNVSRAPRSGLVTPDSPPTPLVINVLLPGAASPLSERVSTTMAAAVSLLRTQCGFSA